MEDKRTSFNPLGHRTKRKPSPRAANMIAEIEASEPRTLTLQEYRWIGSDLTWPDTRLVWEAMERRGYLVAMATTDDGLAIPVTFDVASTIGIPIVLTEHLPGKWRYTTSSESWRRLAGRSGDAEIKGGVVVSVDVSIMS
jgi:hypothetical protein